jgi:hypothetical protein
MRRFGLVLAFLCSGLTAGCDIWFDNSSSGESGELEFTYAGDALFDCLFGCSVETPIAVGATATVFIEDERDDRSFTVRVPDGVTAIYEESFSCEIEHANGEFESRDVAANEPCAQGETRSAFHSVDLTPSSEGTFLLEVLEGDDVIDSIELVAHQAASVSVRTVNDDGIVPALELHLGESVTINADLIDADGQPLYLDDIEFAWSIDDAAIAEVSSDWGDAIFGPATSAEVVALERGSTVLRFEGAGVSGQIPVAVQ